MLADAEAAVAGLPKASDWRPSALVAQGTALLLLDRDEEADAVLASAADCAAELGSTETRVVALAERALLAGKRGEHERAEKLANEAHGLVTTSGVEGAPVLALENAATVVSAVAAVEGKLDFYRLNDPAFEITPAVAKMQQKVRFVPRDDWTGTDPRGLRAEDSRSSPIIFAPESS